MVKLWERFKAKIRLKKIENAIGIKLMPRQREVCLNPARPVFKDWGRASGKTVAACVWTLMWRKEPIYFDMEQIKLVPERRMVLKDKIPAIPDSDATTYQRLMSVYQQYVEFCVYCTQHGIQVATVVNFGKRL